MNLGIEKIRGREKDTDRCESKSKASNVKRMRDWDFGLWKIWRIEKEKKEKKGGGI